MPTLQEILANGGDPNAPGLLGLINRGTSQLGGAGNLGLSLLANSGPSATPRTFGQILGQSAIDSQNMQAGRQEQALKQQLVQAQLKALQAKPAVTPPQAVQEYEYAKGQGFGGTFADWQAQQKNPSTPAAIQEYQFAKTNGFQGSFTDYQDRAKNQPMDELAKLTADYKGGRISEADYKARRSMMTTRPANMYADVAPDDPKVDAAAKLIARYDQAPLTSMALRTPFGQAVTQKVLELNPEYHGEEFPKRQAAYKAFATGKQGDQVRAFNVGISHLNTASDLADALGNGDIPAINKISQAWAQATGSAAPTNLDTAKEVIKGEIVKAVVGGQAAAGDRERALAGIDRASSPAQLKGAIQVAQKLMGGQLGGLRRQYENSTGRKDFESQLSPDSIPYLSTKEGMGDENAGKNSKLSDDALLTKWGK